MMLLVKVCLDEPIASSLRLVHGQTQTEPVTTPYAETLERCVLDAQRLHSRLEGLVHQLSAARRETTGGPAGALPLLKESIRRLELELDEFAFDAEAILSMLSRAARHGRNASVARRDA